MDSSKLKAFADNLLNVAKLIISLKDGKENIGGKGIADYQHFYGGCRHRVYELSKTQSKILTLK